MDNKALMRCWMSVLLVATCSGVKSFRDLLYKANTACKIGLEAGDVLVCINKTFTSLDLAFYN